MSKDTSATADQLRAAEKRKAAAKEAEEARASWHAPAARSTAPKGRRGKQLDKS